MSDALMHFPVYIGDALKKFIEYPTMQERGAWLSIVVGLVQNDGLLPDDESLYFKCLCFGDQDKQVLKQVLSKCLSKGKDGYYSEEINTLINKQKALRDKRREAGRKGGSKSPKDKQKLKQSESESESELNTESEPKESRELAPPIPFQEMIDLWNDKIQKTIKPNSNGVMLTKARRSALQNRYKQEFHNNLDEWVAYLEAITCTPFLMGDNERMWAVDIDWALKPANIVKVSEEKYGSNKPREKTREERLAEINQTMRDMQCKQLTLS